MGDLKIPVALVFAMAVQLVGLVWYISNIVHDIEHLQGQVSVSFNFALAACACDFASSQLPARPAIGPIIDCSITLPPSVC